MVGEYAHPTELRLLIRNWSFGFDSDFGIQISGLTFALRIYAMRSAKTLRFAFRALRSNIMRSALTCVGIIIGIAAVIAMMEIGNGVTALNQKAIASLGANNLIVQPGMAASGGISMGAGSSITLTPQDCEAIVRECPAVRGAAPIVWANAQIVYGSHNWVPMSIVGTSPDYLDVRQWPLDDGACFTDQDVRNISKVCLIGPTLKRELFDNDNPIGKELRLGNVSLRVLGVLSPKGANMFGRDQDDVIVAPWTTIKYRVSGKTSGASSAAPSASTGGSSTAVNTLNNPYPTSNVQLYPAPSPTQAADTPQPIRFTNINQILTAADSSEDIPAAIKQITALLRERHRTAAGESNDFSINDMTELMSTLASTTELIGKLLMIVAAISLVVGGVGIMNIMLVSVTERTHEIGLRMAVGARAFDILGQFLTEAVILCLLGGATGIALGRIMSMIVRWTL
ncbi:MAG: Phosphonate-transporting ATPase, partial [Phycisphaerales bacterium]|nr:Phosphonate-transporting ATPase [Phycisphaerales bacterium]